MIDKRRGFVGLAFRKEEAFRWNGKSKRTDMIVLNFLDEALVFVLFG